MNMLIHWLKKPYFFTSSVRFKFVLSTTLGLFVWFFLSFFKPFEIIKLTDNLFLYTFGFGLITFLVLIFNLFFLPFVFKRFFNEKKWTVGKHFIFVLGSFFIINLLNWNYNNFLQGTNTKRSISFLTLLSYTLSVGCIPIVILLLKEELLIREKRSEITQEVNDKQNKPSSIETNSKTIKITTGNKNETLKLNLNNLLCVNSQGNYACFFIIKKEKTKEVILRTSLQNVYSQLEKYNYLIRCHKSYIVNTKHIDKISGNARGYQLHCSKLEFIIPVSRMFPKENLKNLIH